jgi:hypothetical protein
VTAPLQALRSGWRALSLHPLLRPLTEARIGLQWRLAGRPVPPPPLVKQAIIKEHQQRFGLRVLVETGTFAGEMIHAVVDRFDRIYSIELDPGWHARAVARFAKQSHVILLR